MNLRNGKSTEEDWHLFLSRKPQQSHIDCRNITKLSFSNQSVAKHNRNMLDSLGLPIAEIKSMNTPQAALKLSSEESGGLENQLFLTKGAKVMLTRN